MTVGEQEPPPLHAERLLVRLYVAGAGPNSTTAVHNLRTLLAQHAEHRVEVEVIDVLKAPERSASEGVFVTPMLVKVEPPPQRRILGNLSCRQTLLSVLGLDEPPRE